MDIQAELADPAYRTFQMKLIPTVDPACILGVRMPALRSFARTLWRARPGEARAFLDEPLPHATYDEMNLHGVRLVLLVCAHQAAQCHAAPL